MDRFTISRRIILLALLAAVAAAGVAALCGGDALAQARNPFNVGISEGGAPPSSGILAWAFAQQVAFERLLSGAVRAIKSDSHAVWGLMGLSFAYGVFHAAGPGHGKAVVASYMLASQQALKRGLAISFLAAMLQGLVAVAIVGVLAYLLNATAARMKSVANLVELASFGGVALLGLWLMWRKGAALLATWQAQRAVARAQARDRSVIASHDHDSHDHDGHDHGHAHLHDTHGHDHDHGSAHGHGVALKPAVARIADDHLHDHHDHDAPGHVHDEHCGHFHAPDPNTLGDNFSWGTALATVVTAGARPCSGAILVLVFAFAQGIFLAGVAAAFAMALGTAVTTGALAAMAVLAKGLAVRFAGEGGGKGVLLVRTLEFTAAAAIFLIGAVLLAGSLLQGPPGH